MRIAQRLAGQRVDGLHKPGGRARGEIDPRADAQHEAAGLYEVEIPLEQAATGRNVNADVADLNVPQAEGVGEQAFIEGNHRANLVHVGRAARIVLEVDGVRQLRADRHVTIRFVDR